MRLLAFRGRAERPPAARHLRAVCNAGLGLMLGLSLQAHAQTPTPMPTPTALSVADYRAYLPPTHSVRQALQGFADAVQRSSQGQLRITVLPGTVAGTPAEQIEALRSGQPGAPQIMLVAATGLSALHRPLEWFDLPYAARDVQQVEAIVEGAQGQALLDGLRAHGLVGLAWMENGFRSVSTADARIGVASDFQGLKIRTLPAATSLQTFEAWGAQAVAIPAAQVHEALRSGRVQAQEGFVTHLVQSRLHEVQRHLWLTEHSYGAQLLVVREASWQALSAAQQTWLGEAARAAARLQRTRSRAEVRAALDWLQSQGMQIHAVSRDTAQALADQTRHLRPTAGPPRASADSPASKLPAVQVP